MRIYANMKTVAKIDPEKEYKVAKEIVGSLAVKSDASRELSKLDGSLDNLNTVINVLLERATPKKR